MSELNEDLQAQVKLEIEGKELTSVQKSMLLQKYGLLEPQPVSEEFDLHVHRGDEWEAVSKWNPADLIYPESK